MPPKVTKKLEEIFSEDSLQNKCDYIQILNLPEVADSPKAAYEIIEKLLKQHKESYAKNRSDLATMMVLDKTCQMGTMIDGLNKRLQDHVRMLNKTESSTKQPNAVLEHDMAKRRADKLAEILRAKLIWDNTFEELQLLDASDISMRFQKLVSLQNSFGVLVKYSLDKSKVESFERIKDEFLSWYSPATILALDSNDLKQLEDIKDKYLLLNHVNVFEANFGNYARNKIKCFIEDESKTHSLWSILEEFFTIWKRCHKTVDYFVETDGSVLVSSSLYEGITAKWQTILTIINNMISESENPLDAAKSIGKVLNDFLIFVQRDGDQHILEIALKLKQSIFAVLSEDYGKHITSLLLCTVNKITAPEKSSWYRHNWLMPYLEDIQSQMRDIVNEAKNTFGPLFPMQIISAFELGVREINSLIQNQDILNIKPEKSDLRMSKSVQENTEDKLSAICVTGYLINMIDDINSYIQEMFMEVSTQSHEQSRLISNGSLLETLNLKVVGKKIESIANAIIFPMEKEMENMIQQHFEETTGAGGDSVDYKDELTLSLPSFSISPHNYATGAGHGLLSQMNTISAYGNDRNFVRAIISAASNTNSQFNEDEADLWLLTEVAKLVQSAFCSKIGNVSQLPLKLKRQFYADIVFLMDALADLRLQPTKQLSKLADKLKE